MDFEAPISCVKECLLPRGYPKIVVNNQMDKTVFCRDLSVKKTLDIPFLTTNHLKVKELGKLLQNCFFLYSFFEKLFSPSSMVSYRST